MFIKLHVSGLRVMHVIEITVQEEGSASRNPQRTSAVILVLLSFSCAEIGGSGWAIEGFRVLSKTTVRLLRCAPPADVCGRTAPLEPLRAAAALPAHYDGAVAADRRWHFTRT